MNARLHTSDPPESDSKQNGKKFRSLVKSNGNGDSWISHHEKIQVRKVKLSVDGEGRRVSVDGFEPC